MESNTLAAASGGRAVQVTIPAEVAFDLDRFQRVQRDILGRLGCMACCSGWDIRYDVERRFIVDARLNVRAADSVELVSPGEGRSSDSPLTIQDHTAIVRAIMERPFHVIRYMDESTRTPNPSPRDVLEAALQVEQFDNYTKDRIRIVLDILPRIEEAQKSAQPTLKRAAESLRKQLEGMPLPEQARMLRDLKAKYKEHEGLPEGMEFAAQMLEDGQASIYSPDFGFYQMLKEGGRGTTAVARDAVDTVKDADAIGAALGGGAGLIVAGVGAGPGAAAGGAGASVGAIIGSVIAWLW